MWSVQFLCALALLVQVSASGFVTESVPTVFWAGRPGLFKSKTANEVLNVGDVHSIATSLLAQERSSSSKYTATRSGEAFAATKLLAFVSDKADSGRVQQMMGSRTSDKTVLKSLVAASPSSLVVQYTDLSSPGRSLGALLQDGKGAGSMSCQDAEHAVQKQQLESNKVLVVHLAGDSVLADEKCIGLVSQYVSHATKGNYVGLLSYSAGEKMPVSLTESASQRARAHLLHRQRENKARVTLMATSTATAAGTGSVVYLNSTLLTGLLVSLLLVGFTLWGISTLSSVHTPLRFGTKDASIAKIY